jgi:CubicO group peptidase (beta-lactamase class C family)
VAATAPAELTESEARLFLDDFFEREMEAQQVVGAGVVVVSGGEVLASGGYGFADLEERRPVDPAGTLFPAQSVSKLFAATAVMQQVERGELDLHRDVRTYLGEVPVRNDFDQPVTLAHLLTHTAGFDDSYVGFLPRHADDKLTVPDFLTRYARTVIFRPGTVHAYSNYGSLLSRHAIEVVTGRHYEDYLVDEIVRPLGMEQTCPLPPPAGWADRIATGYLPARDGVESTRDAFPDGLVRFRTRTGTLASTVLDMAHFMIAHLEGGSYAGGRILEPETLELMHAQQFAQHPRLPGATYGFFESSAHGQHGILHFGSGFGYGTFLYLMPEHGIGLYVAHSNSSSRISEALLDAFLERFFPAEPLPEATFRLKPMDKTAEHYAGSYRQVRRPETTFEKLLHSLLQGRFRATDAHTLSHDQFLPREWRMTGPSVFERPEGGGILAFELDDAGTPRLLSLADNELPQLLVLERVPWYDSTPALLARLGWFFLVFAVVVVGSPILAWRRRRAGAGSDGWPRRAIWGAAALNLAFFLGLVWVFASQQFFYPVSATLVAILSLPLVATALTVVALTQARSRPATAGRLTRLLHAATLATLALFPLFLWRWNLLGFHF